MPRPAARGRAHSPLSHWRSAAAAPPPRSVRLLTSSPPRPAPDGHRARPISARPPPVWPNGRWGRAAGGPRPRAIDGERLSDGSASRCPAPPPLSLLFGERPRRWLEPSSVPGGAANEAEGGAARGQWARRGGGSRWWPRGAALAWAPPLRCAPRAAEGPARRYGRTAPRTATATGTGPEPRGPEPRHPALRPPRRARPRPRPRPRRSRRCRSLPAPRPPRGLSPPARAGPSAPGPQPRARRALCGWEPQPPAARAARGEGTSRRRRRRSSGPAGIWAAGGGRAGAGSVTGSALGNPGAAA
ncbi:proline-rich protein HaeIII subfamily 1-like [Sylvia atricapilla]|uniref:proline-rich protein HaeIII subfamily 1-like n=1 Tax=Sylvia atricapilla TaxID=48155 RepID=UPI00339876F9